MELLRVAWWRDVCVQVDVGLKGERCLRLVISRAIMVALETFSAWLERERITSSKENR